MICAALLFLRKDGRSGPSSALGHRKARKGETKSAIPYKIYLSEDEMPKAWYNLRADMKTKPAPMLDPGTHLPMTAEDLSSVFCSELAAQELDNDTPYFEIPREIYDFYKMYRPSPPGQSLLP